jgi:hypothetical protein
VKEPIGKVVQQMEKLAVSDTNTGIARQKTSNLQESKYNSNLNYDSQRLTSSSTVTLSKKILKMLLLSADLTLTTTLEKQSSCTFYVICKIKSAEWRSKPSDKEGLKLTWT